MTTHRIHRFYPGDRIAFGDRDSGDEWDIGTVRLVSPGVMLVHWDRAHQDYNEAPTDLGIRPATPADEALVGCPVCRAWLTQLLTRKLTAPHANMRCGECGERELAVWRALVVGGDL